MDERLAAFSKQLQDYCIEELQKAVTSAAPYKGKITAKVRKRRSSAALEAYIDGLGKIIMIDNVYHPSISGYVDKKGYRIYGRGTFPWAHWSIKDKLLREYNLK